MICLLRRLLEHFTAPTRDALVSSRCWWCAHPRTVHDDNGCQTRGCPCADLV